MRTISSNRQKKCLRIGRSALQVTVLLALCAGGCGQLAVHAGNTVSTGEQDTFLPALVERGHGLFSDRLDHVEVSFYAGGKELARALTDEVGYAVAVGRIPPGARTLEARANVNGHALRSESEVLSWQPGRTVLVCDVDGTISKSDLGTLIYAVVEHADFTCPEVPDAAETLQVLSKQYNIVYLTDRPVYLREASYKWLNLHKFPPGPVICTPNLKTSEEVLKFKRGIIGKMKELYPDALIGFGNEETDADAYVDNGMLAIMVDDGKHPPFRRDAYFLRTWTRIHQFLDDNHDVLRDPSRLRTMMSQGRLPFTPPQGLPSKSSG